MNLEKLETHNFPFTHWEMNNCLDEKTIKEIGFSTIPSGNRVYDGTRAADHTGEGEDGKLRLFITKANSDLYPNLTKLINKMQNYNLYNFGVGSYAPSVHLYKLRQAIKQNIIPDKILLFLDLSDVLDEARRWVDDVDSAEGMPRRPEDKPHWAKKKKFFTTILQIKNIIISGIMIMN